MYQWRIITISAIGILAVVYSAWYLAFRHHFHGRFFGYQATANALIIDSSSFYQVAQVAIFKPIIMADRTWTGQLFLIDPSDATFVAAAHDIEYEKVKLEALSGDETALATFLKISQWTDAASAEEYGPEMSEVIEKVGDIKTADALSAATRAVRDDVWFYLSSEDGFGEQADKKFPKTNAICCHSP